MRDGSGDVVLVSAMERQIIFAQKLETSKERNVELHATWNVPAIVPGSSDALVVFRSKRLVSRLIVGEVLDED
jgi:hypothetical protein